MDKYFVFLLFALLESVLISNLARMSSKTDLLGKFLQTLIQLGNGKHFSHRVIYGTHGHTHTHTINPV